MDGGILGSQDGRRYERLGRNLRINLGRENNENLYILTCRVL
jgi:hypothetical protein